MNSNIFLVVQDGGGGHRVSAQALEAALTHASQTGQFQGGRSLTCHRVDLYRDILHLPIAYGYNLMLRLGWTGLFWPVTVPWFRWHRRIRRNTWLGKLQHYWQQQQPDLVVSLIPFVNRELYQSLQAIRSGTPLVILLTDLASDPPNFWLEPWQGEQHLLVICPTPRAIHQALALGYPKSQLFQTSGVILHPRFYQWVQPLSAPLLNSIKPQFCLGQQFRVFDPAQERQRLGLDPHLPTGVLCFGGQGDNIMLQIARRLDASALPLQLIFLCGKNQSLVNKLRRQSHHYPWLVEGFTDNIPYYLSLADFLIGKPGPASLSEAIALNLPVITLCNGSTLWHERYNAQWVQDQGLGIVLQDFRGIAQAVASLMQPQTLKNYQDNAKTIENWAIFEVTHILQKILQES